jgi:dynein heavy chain
MRYTVFTWVSRGLFEKHKLILSSQLTFILMSKKALGDGKALDPDRFDFLIKAPRKYGAENPLDWLSDGPWSCLCKMAELAGISYFFTLLTGHFLQKSA